MLMRLFGEYSLQVDDNDCQYNNTGQCKPEPMEVSSTTEPEESFTPTTHMTTSKCQPYCLVIFNNPRWSRILHKTSTQMPKTNPREAKQQPQAASQQHHENLQASTNKTVQSLVKPELNEDEQENEQNILSPKLSELTTKTSEEVQVTTSVKKKRHASSTTSQSVYPKKIKMIGSNDDEDDTTFEIDMKKDQTPYYLSLNNKLFLRTSKDILKSVQTITINDIQQIAILMHQIGALKIKIDQTNIYLKAVTGTLTEPESDLIDVDRRVWPMQVQSMMSSKRESNSVTTTESNHENTQRDCENLLHQRLQETSQQIQGFEQELTEKKQTFFEFTST
ncbi:unnamed protein product, partial [Rotaria sp. Silwood1]